MINVITVHWKSAKWIDPQLSYLKRFVNAPYRVFASLNGIDDPTLRRRFHYAAELEGSRLFKKLNPLAALAVEQSEVNDVLMFLDGDAFPIQSLQPWLDETLAHHKLVAIQRVENRGDLRPHPSFCATTVGFWKDLGGSWEPEEWVSPEGGKFGDAGGMLFRQLESNGTNWLPLRRTNTRDLHPLWCGVYGHRVYHHGAGFRVPVSKADWPGRSYLKWAKQREQSLGRLSVKIRQQPSLLLQVRGRHTRTLTKAAGKTLGGVLKTRFAARAQAASDAVFEELSSDDHFYRKFDSTVP